MPSHFSFLQPVYPEIYGIGILSEKLYSVDPSSSIAKARLFAEKISMLIWDFEELDEFTGKQVERINQLAYRNCIPDIIKGILHTIRKAIATFERTIVSESTRFDRFINGEADRFSDYEVLGLHLFRTKARCINCHNTGYFSDNEFHNTGLTYYGRTFEDLGLYEVTFKKEDVGKFKTASLREVSRTGPHMHNGLFPHLEGIVNLYNAGMPQPKRKAHQVNDSLFPTTSNLLKPLNLTNKEKFALVAFIKTLESRNKRETPPELPH